MHEVTICAVDIQDFVSQGAEGLPELREPVAHGGKTVQSHFAIVEGNSHAGGHEGCVGFNIFGIESCENADEPSGGRWGNLVGSKRFEKNVSLRGGRHCGLRGVDPGTLKSLDRWMKIQVKT